MSHISISRLTARHLRLDAGVAVGEMLGRHVDVQTGMIGK